MAKRSRPPATTVASAEPITKKSKASASTDSKNKAAPRKSTLEAVQSTIKSVATALGEAVDVAGDLVLDDPAKTPVPVSALVEDNVDVEALKGNVGKAAKGAKGKAKGAAAAVGDAVVQAEEVAQNRMEEKGVKVKAAKGKAKKAAKVAESTVEEAVTALEPEVGKVAHATKPLKGKVAKAAAEAQAKAKATELAKEVKDPKSRKRKTAEEFMHTAKETVRGVMGKVGVAVGEVLQNVVEEFGEASGMTGEKYKAGKRKAETDNRSTKKAKSTKAIDEPVIEKGIKAANSATDTIVATGKKAGKVAGAAAKAAVEAAQEDYIDGFASSDGADSSDDESDMEHAAVKAAGEKVDMSRLPMVAKDDKSVAARLKKAQKNKDTQRGTLYLGRIPHGFYEDQMKEYFSQFGDVNRLRLARNKKTGASKHYAYIEMSSQSVAEIVAETMNNYLLMGHLLKCQVIPPDNMHPELWVGANRKFRKVPRARVEKIKHEKERTKEQQDKANTSLLDKQEKRKRKIKDKGIDYEFDGHA